VILGIIWLAVRFLPETPTVESVTSEGTGATEVGATDPNADLRAVEVRRDRPAATGIVVDLKAAPAESDVQARTATADNRGKALEDLRRALGSLRASVFQARRVGPGELEQAYRTLRETHRQLAGQAAALPGDPTSIQRELNEIMDVLFKGENEGRFRNLREDLRAHDEQVRRFRGLSRSAAAKEVSGLLAQNEQLMKRSRELGPEADVLVSALQKVRITLISATQDR